MSQLSRLCHKRGLNQKTYSGPSCLKHVSLTKSLVKDSLSFLIHKQVYRYSYFLLKKMYGTFALQKFLTIFQQKMVALLHTIPLQFKDSLSLLVRTQPSTCMLIFLLRKCKELALQKFLTIFLQKTMVALLYTIHLQC